MGETSKVFKAGNSAAIRLPKRFGMTPGMEVILKEEGGKVTISRAEDPEQVRRDLQAAFVDIDAIWARHGGPPATSMEREPDIFPDRPGLYS